MNMQAQASLDATPPPKRVVLQVRPHILPVIWPHAEPLIASAASHSRGQYTAQDIYDEVMKSERQLWVAATGGKLEAVLCTKVAQHPSTRSLYVSMAAGDTNALQDFMGPVREFGQRWDCKLMVVQGRKGFERAGILPPEFRHTANIWTAEI